MIAHPESLPYPSVQSYERSGNAEVHQLSITNLIRETIRPYYLRLVYFPLQPERRPRSFQDCWQHPAEPLEESSDILAGLWQAEGCGVVFYPMNDWHGRTQRSKQLARALANLGHPIVYVNPHMGREFANLRLIDKRHRVTSVEHNVVELHIRLPREPVFHERVLLPDEGRIVARAVREVLATSGLKSVCQIVSLPTWMDAACHVRSEDGCPVIYDCHDHLPGLPKMAPQVATAESDALRRADCVLFTSDHLYKSHGTCNRSILLRNAASGPVSVQRPSRAGTVSKRPVAGYVGALSAWFDVESVQRAAECNPEVDFVLAGEVECEEIGKLGLLPNVSLLGEVRYDDLDELYARFDVGLIPFVLNDLTRATNPIKFYEYCSFGMPIVSTRLPEMEAFADVVRFAAGPGDFASQVRRSLVEPDGQGRKRRLEIAGRETWTARAGALSAEFDALHSADGRVRSKAIYSSMMDKESRPRSSSKAAGR